MNLNSPCDFNVFRPLKSVNPTSGTRFAVFENVRRYFLVFWLSRSRLSQFTREPLILKNICDNFFPVTFAISIETILNLIFSTDSDLFRALKRDDQTSDTKVGILLWKKLKLIFFGESTNFDARNFQFLTLAVYNFRSFWNHFKLTQLTI